MRLRQRGQPRNDLIIGFSPVLAFLIVLFDPFILSGPGSVKHISRNQDRDERERVEMKPGDELLEDVFHER